MELGMGKPVTVNHTSHHCTWPPIYILSGPDTELQLPPSLDWSPILPGTADTTPPGCRFPGASTIPSPVALWACRSVLKFPSALLPPWLYHSLLSHPHCGLAVAQSPWLESASGWTNRLKDTVIGSASSASVAQWQSRPSTLGFQISFLFF